tara:strand:+ start:275 stop:655 length:381 start_codon:yes stop_codon:yes gene_type:complete
MPKKKITAKKAKVSEMSQTDGMARDESKKFEATTLDQIWGDDGTSKYKTLDASVYEQVVGNMSKSDLKNEAIRIGLLPIDNVMQLKARLLREFSAHVNSYRMPPEESAEKHNAAPEEIKNILKEGS